MPGFAFPTVGPLGLGSPPSRTKFLSVLRYYAPLRLPTTLFVSLHSSLAHDTLQCSFVFVRPLQRLADSQELACQHQGSWSTGTPILPVSSLRREMVGPHKFLSYPFECMPRSSTTVVPWMLALTLGSGGSSTPFELVLSPATLVVCTPPALLPSALFDSVGFPSLLRREVILKTTKVHFSGLNHAACILATPGLEPPAVIYSPLDVRGFATHRLARP